MSVSANARATRALERLCEHFDEARVRSPAGEDLERAACEFHVRFVEAEREVLRSLLEGLDDGMALRRRTSHLDGSRTDAKFTLRPGVGIAIRDFSSRRDRPG